MAEMLKAPRGTTDILPPQTAKWAYVERMMRRIADEYGYEEVRTPIFEHTELFSRSIGEGSDIVAKEMYTFADKAERSLTLRPELTAPSMRAYLEHQLVREPLVKWFYLGPGFRYERPQSGRFRQFHQFGVEAFGSMHPALDAEVIALAIEMFSQLEMKHLEVKVNSIGCKNCRPNYRESLRKYFSPHREALCEDCRGHRLEKNPLRILDCKVPSCRPIIEKAPVSLDSLCAECADHFKKLQEWLDLIGMTYSVDSHLVRGLEYYTKTVFEVVSTSLGAQNSLCGGGRYDDLSEALSGPARPAVGFAAGIERIILAMESHESKFPERGIDLFVVALGEEALRATFPIILRLRRQGLRIRLDYHRRSLGSQLKEADRFNAQWALILGEDELKNGTAILRNMRSREQESCALGVLESAVIGKLLSGTKAHAGVLE